jgi:hypothetical protein
LLATITHGRSAQARAASISRRPPRGHAAVADRHRHAIGDLAHADYDRQHPTRRGCYRDLCFKIFGTDASGSELEVGDGGMTDWTQQLLGDRKERLLISGVGTERLAR